MFPTTAWGFGSGAARLTTKWDVNESFGGYRNGLNIPQTYSLDPFYLAGSEDRPLINRLISKTDARQAYLAHTQPLTIRGHRACVARMVECRIPHVAPIPSPRSTKGPPAMTRP
ncbi:MAG: hypothetical protein CME06_10130 [Gemmatimonadetes bacterium]|nr:hypothetical protein [Gemmatimonadota bacterium]